VACGDAPLLLLLLLVLLLLLLLLLSPPLPRKTHPHRWHLPAASDGGVGRGAEAVRRESERWRWHRLNCRRGTRRGRRKRERGASDNTSQCFHVNIERVQ